MVVPGGGSVEIQQIPVKLCYVPEVRVTAVYDEEQLRLLHDSISAMGTVQPIVVVEVDGRYEVVDGLHRLQEARDRGQDLIDAVVRQGSAADALTLNLVLNKVRGKTRASEMVSVISTLTVKHNLTSEEIAARTGLTRDYIERLQQISRAAPSVREALDLEVIGVGIAYELSRLPSHLQQEEMMAKQRVYQLKTRELHEFVDDVLRRMAEMREKQGTLSPGDPPPPPIYTCESCHAETAPRYLRPVTLCPECFGKVWRIARDAPPAGDHPAHTAPAP